MLDKALEERVLLGTRSERVPQIEERERNEITFFQEGTEQERNGNGTVKCKRNGKGTVRSFSVPFQ